MSFFSVLDPHYTRLAIRLKTRSWAAILIFFSNILVSLAQETPPLVNYFSYDYKAHNQNWAITQSSDHLIYSANSDGLLEYDGSAWKLYPLPDGQIVRTVLYDETTVELQNGKTRKEQRIYAGGFSEFGYWKKENDGQLKYYSLSRNANFPGLKTEEIWHIVKTPRHIYFQSFAKIYRYDGRHITEIKAVGNFMFLRYVHGRVLVPVIGQSIYELKDREFVPLPGTESLSSSIISAILPLPDNRILITTTKNGLYIWKDGTLAPWNIDSAGELKRNIINKAIVLGKDNSIAVGTIQNGVYIISKNGRLKYNLNKESGLQNNTVLTLAEDAKNNLWIGMDQGIATVGMSSPLVSYHTSDNPLGSTYAAAIWRGRLYVGSNKGVFVKKWLSNEPFRAVPGLEGQTWMLSVFNDQLLCGHNDATFAIGENGIRKISEITGGWTMIPIRSGHDTLLLQGAYNGLHVYQKNNSGKWIYAYPVRGVPPTPIRQIVRDQKNNFWLAHAYKGLFSAKLSPRLDSAIRWKEYTSPDDIPTEYSVEICEWNKNVLIRTGNSFREADPNGLLRLNKDFKTEEDPFKLRTGSRGDWFKVYIDHVLYFPKAGRPQGLPVTLIRNSETIIPLTDQYYLFCLDNGYALYDRSAVNNTGSDESVPLIRKVGNLRNSWEVFPVEGAPALPAAARSLRITYALPVYGQNIQFQYRMRGLSDQWSDWTDQNFAEFTNLESAEYTFEVRSNVGGKTAAYHFNIRPYWRETLLARILFGILITAALIGLVFYQEKRLRRHRKKLMSEQEEKLRQQRLTSERQIIQIQNEKLQMEIQNKSQQLSNVAINVVRKNEILEEIRDELKQVKAEMGQQLPNIHYQKLLNSIERNVAGKDDWVLFEQNFDEVHEQFFKRLRQVSPGISPSELRLAACLRMNLSTKEMAPVLGISVRGVEIKRYRLRKKLELPMDANLVEYMMDI